MQMVSLLYQVLLLQLQEANDDHPNQTNNLGAHYFTFVIETAATDLDIKTDGTDKFVGALYLGKSDAAGKTFISGASNDVITLNGTTKGGDSWYY